MPDRAEREWLEGRSLNHGAVYTEDPQAPKWPQWVTAEGNECIATRRGSRFNGGALAVETVVEGAGVVLCCIAMTRQRLAAGVLTL